MRVSPVSNLILPKQIHEKIKKDEAIKKFSFILKNTPEIKGKIIKNERLNKNSKIIIGNKSKTKIKSLNKVSLNKVSLNKVSLNKAMSELYTIIHSKGLTTKQKKADILKVIEQMLNNKQQIKIPVKLVKKLQIIEKNLKKQKLPPPTMPISYTKNPGQEVLKLGKKTNFEITQAIHSIEIVLHPIKKMPVKTQKKIIISKKEVIKKQKKKKSNNVSTSMQFLSPSISPQSPVKKKDLSTLSISKSENKKSSSVNNQTVSFPLQKQKNENFQQKTSNSNQDLHFVNFLKLKNELGKVIHDISEKMPLKQATKNKTIQVSMMNFLQNQPTHSFSSSTNAPTENKNNQLQQMIQNQVIKLTHNATTGMVHEIVIKLHPNNEATVEIQVLKNEQGIQATIQTDNANLMNGLQHMMVATQKSLSEQGINLQFNVTTHQEFSEKRKEHKQNNGKEEKENGKKKPQLVEMAAPQFKV